MAEICLRYLLMEDLKDCEGKSGSNIRNLLEYSAVHWPDHVRHMNSTVYQLTDLLYQGDEKRPSMDVIHLAAFNGHEQVVHSLCAEDQSVINIADSTGSYPILLECGADVNAQGGLYGNALQAACFEGHYNAVQLLVEHGADVNSRGGLYGNALQAACFEGHYNAVQLLVEHGADVNSQGGLYVTALQAAHSQGHDEIVQMLQLHSVAQSVSHRHPCKRSKTS
ncbi:hypothetical protein N7467_001681 [Penicillium canescens]|nr:hypothetical protein N7467_001681 [Penicillium canescens]